MAKNIFSLFQGYVPKPKRNVFDLSFNNNLTTKFGQLTPILCKEVIPGDSFKIDTAAGLRLMPMAFPVQTPMKAYIHYFYVRNRALWDGWQDFITGTKKDLVPPYIAFNTSGSGEAKKRLQIYDGTEYERKQEFFKVGGIADYFGVPNVVYTGKDSDIDNGGDVDNGGDAMKSRDISTQVDTYPIVGANNTVYREGYSENSVVYSPFETTGFVPDEFIPYASYNSLLTFYAGDDENTYAQIDNFVRNAFDQLFGTTRPILAYRQLDPNRQPNPWKNVYDNIGNYSDVTQLPTIPWSGIFSVNLPERSMEQTFVGTGNFEVNIPLSYTPSSIDDVYVPLIGVTRDKDNKVLNVINMSRNATYELYQNNIIITIPDFAIYADRLDVFGILPTEGTLSNSDKTLTLESKLDDSFIDVSYQLDVDTDIDGDGEDTNTGVIGGNEGTLLDTPFDKEILLSALPFRAYECIYNSYYRNMQNNPYILDGVTEYNKFIPSKDGGADYNYYPLHQRNWEYDFMTSAVPSPQFGIAPLVGITMTGTATFADEDGNTYYAQAELDTDGTITGWSTHSSNMPAGTLRMLMDSVGTGISINDLRNVNSFQRFLENSLRVGLKYRDQIKGHFGVEVRYDELDMPEFIGGMSLDINVNQVTQTADVQDSSYPLAGFAGQGGAFGSSTHSVSKYCDEHGFIIGILSVVPVPVYSQLLPKFFIKREQLDYFFPEFGHIGYQPILQKEISPLQSFYLNEDLNKVFGYQRAWYDYIASVDEVHAQFRTTLRDFVMNRTFEHSPALNEEFLLVDPEQVNDVFLSTESGEYSPASDKILGQIYFKITKKSPIPKLGIPRLTD